MRLVLQCIASFEPKLDFRASLLLTFKSQSQQKNVMTVMTGHLRNGEKQILRNANCHDQPYVCGIRFFRDLNR